MVGRSSIRIVPLALALTDAAAFGGSGSDAGGDGGNGAVGGDRGSGGAAGSGGSGGSGAAGGGGTGAVGGGGSGGSGGTGGAVGTLCMMDVDCNDDNDCTQGVCNRAEGSCSYQNQRDGSLCDVDVRPGLCRSGMCESVPCDFDCNDQLDCTRDLCLDPAGCFNLAELDGAACDANGNAGTCRDGLCEALP